MVRIWRYLSSEAPASGSKSEHFKYGVLTQQDVDTNAKILRVITLSAYWILSISDT